MENALEDETLEWPWEFRRMGAGPQGSGDVRAFQRAILRGEFRTVPSLLMPLALKSTVLRRDGNGNEALQRGNTGPNRCAERVRFGRWPGGGREGRRRFRNLTGTAGMNRREQKHFYQGREWRLAKYVAGCAGKGRLVVSALFTEARGRASGASRRTYRARGRPPRNWGAGVIMSPVSRATSRAD